MIVILLLYSSNIPLPPPPPPLLKGQQGSRFSKLMATRDLKNFARKGGLVSLEVGGCLNISIIWQPYY